MLKQEIDLQNVRCLDLNKDSKFGFPLGDQWEYCLINAYEPEVEWLLRSARDIPFVILDCGANFGYWAILASSVAYGSHVVLAIEASHANFEILSYNSRLNGGRFQCLHRAVSDTFDHSVRLFGQHHIGLSLRADWDSDSSTCFEEVQTITLDRAADLLPISDYPPIIKLDVEGVEVPALKGGSGLMSNGALIIYEDHGKELRHPATDYILSLGSMEIWHRDIEGRLIRIRDLNQVASIKTNSMLGYNFFAYQHGSVWSELFSASRLWRPSLARTARSLVRRAQCRLRGIETPAVYSVQAREHHHTIEELFDREWYLTRHPDARAAGIEPLVHCLQFDGRWRDPNELFDCNWYVIQNPSAMSPHVHPAVHYLRYGAGQGLDPSPLFSTSWYLSKNPDVKSSGLNPLVHYLRFGLDEGRLPRPELETASK